MSLFTRKPDKVVVGTARRRTRISTDSPSERVIYHRSGIPSRGGHPTDRAHRGVAAPMSYGFWLRLADNWDGWLDGRHAGDRPLADLEWAQRLQDLHEENVNRLYAATADVNYAHVADLQALLARKAQLDAAIRDTRADLEQVPEPRTGAGPAEGHVDERIIAQRRRAEHSRAKEPVRQRLSALRDEQHEVITQALDLRAQLEEEFAVLLRIEERHRSFYQRRLRTYTRRLARGRTDYAGLRHELRAPAWTEQPCPWVPKEADSLVASAVADPTVADPLAAEPPVGAEPTGAPVDVEAA